MESFITLPSVYPVTAHTDFVGNGSTFVVIAGSLQDGLQFVPLALQKGAKTIVMQHNHACSDDLKILIAEYGAKLMFVDDARKVLTELAAQALNFPAKKLKIVAVTGTKGKTSTAYMTYHMLHGMGKKVALMSTVEKRIGGGVVKIDLTTPLPDQIQMFLHVCVQQGVEYVVMEVSAQALTLHRVYDIEFEAAVYTNFSHEHLEFYKDLSEYFQAKKLLITQVKEQSDFFVNIDDYYLADLKKEYPKLSTFSLQDKAATIVACMHVKNNKYAIHVKIGLDEFKFLLPVSGLFNVYNLVSAICLLNALGIDLNAAQQALQTLSGIPGRMEEYHLKNGARCFIDYAHNPSSYEAVLSTLRAMTNHLIVVFGAGGGKDKQKRPVMGSIVQKYADVVILTSDNPRNENPSDIACDVQKGFKPATNFVLHQELNREKAIELSCQISKAGTIIAILGKGRDEYQIIGNVTVPFKERLIIKPFVHEQNQQHL